MAEKKVKTKVKAKVSPAKGKAIKPKLGKGTGGLFTAKIVAHIQEKKKSENKQ